MVRATYVLLLIAALSFLARPTLASEDSWSGTWVTDEGAMTLGQDGDSVSGTYGRGGEIEAKVSGSRLEGTFRVGNSTGNVEFERKEPGHFEGKWTRRGGAGGTWRGWRRDEGAESGPVGQFSGTWLTSIGTLRLEQAGAQVSGPWRNQGWATIKGSAKGRRLEATLEQPSWQGKVWLETTADGKRLYGLTDQNPPAAVVGLKVEGFDPKPKLQAGRIAQGIAENGLLYFVRPPDGWKPGTPVDAIVLLHGSNWTTKGMVWVTAENWPDLAKKYMIVGIQGDLWVPQSEADDLRFNYHYVNWMGKSTYKGYPYTERDSPTLVAETAAELTKKHQWKRVFVGGHSQGGFLTYYLYMHFPEQFAGAFPVSGGLVMQCEPNVFDDERLKTLQRSRPLVIVHGKQDNAVPYETGLYIRDRFAGSGFPLLNLIDPDVGHPYDFLPIGDAVRWLDALSAEKAEPLVALAKDAAQAKRWHDVGVALVRARQLAQEKSLTGVVEAYDAAAREGAARFADLLSKGEAGDWVSEFFEWKWQFENAPASAATMAAYERLRSVHDPKAETLMSEARKAFREQDRDAGRAKYEELAKDCFASGRYPIIMRWLADAR